MKKLILAYCQANQAAANKMVLDISRDAEIVRIVLTEYKGLEQLSKATTGNEDIAAILISDNFLKSEVCMKDALRIIQELSFQKRFIPIVTDGIYAKNGSTTEYMTVPTSFERVSNVIQYMNFWQDHYLSLRRSRTEAGDDAVFSEKVRSVRSISSEVGELLRFLRSVDYWTFDQLTASHYAPVWKYLSMTVPPAPSLAGETPVYSTMSESASDKQQDLSSNIESIHTGFLSSHTQFNTNGTDNQKSPDNGAAFLEKKHGLSLTLEEMQQDAKIISSAENDSLPVYKKEDHLNLSQNPIPKREELSEVIENLKDDPIPPGSDAFSSISARNEPRNPLSVETDGPASTSVHKNNSTENPPLKLAEKEQELHPYGLQNEKLPANSPAAVEHTYSKLFVSEPEGQSKTAESESLPVVPAGAVESTETVLDEVVNPLSNLQNLKQNLDKDPENLKLRFEYADQLSQANKFSEASEQLTTLLERDKNNVDAYLLLAFIAEHNNDFLLSQSLLEKVASLQPDYPGIYYKLATLTKEHFKGQGKKSAQYFREAFTRDKENADAHYQYAIIKLEQSGNYEKAIRHLRKTIQLKPNHPQAHLDLAAAYYEQGNKPEAFDHYQRAVENNSAFKTKINDEIYHFDQPQLVLEPVPLAATANDNGRVVLITGATSGIGLATAEQFARNGFRLILTGRRNDRLIGLKENLETSFRNKVLLLNFDVRSPEEVKTSLASLEEDWKNVDILINNAGLALGFGPIHEGEISDWDTMIDTNIKGLLYMTRAIAPFMAARRKGHIINICSIAGKEVYPNGNVYAATKHAVDALTKAMRLDLYKYNIRVSQVAPGMVEETEFAVVRFHGDAEKAKIYEDFKPLTASDVAEIIYFMASRPEHVNVQDVLVTSVQQGSATSVDRSGRG